MPLANAFQGFPCLGTIGLDGLLVRFGGTWSDASNRAALAFLEALRADPLEGTEEVTMSLTSVLFRFDPFSLELDDAMAAMAARLDARDWYEAPLPDGRCRWEVPTIYGTDLAPGFAEASAAAGLSQDAAIASLSKTTTRVQTIGFAPGQPYLGQLPEAWDIPRQTALTPRVTKGALVVAIRQLVLFAVDAPTGWRQVGQTAFPLFDPEREPATLLRPGDEVRFVSVPREAWDDLVGDPMGGAQRVAIS